MEWLKFFIITVYTLKTFLLYISQYQNISPIPQIMCLLYCTSWYSYLSFTCQTLTVAEIQAFVKMVVLVSTLTLISSDVIANLALLVTSAKLVSTATKVKMEETSIKQSMSQSVNQSMRLSGWGHLWLEHILHHGPSWDSIGLQGSYNGCNVFSIIAFCGTTNLDTTKLWRSKWEVTK